MESSSSSAGSLSKEEFVAVTTKCRKETKAGVNNAFQIVVQQYMNAEKNVPSHVVLGATLGCIEAATSAMKSAIRNKVLTAPQIVDILDGILHELIKEEEHGQTRDRTKDN